MLEQTNERWDGKFEARMEMLTVCKIVARKLNRNGPHGS
jgi:hypothetical protein